MNDFIKRVGIVKGVEARYVNDEPKNLAASVRFDTEVISGDRWSSKDIQIDDMTITFPLGSPVNAGDVITLTVDVAAPFGQRFQPALEASEPEPDHETVVVDFGGANGEVEFNVDNEAIDETTESEDE